MKMALSENETIASLNHEGHEAEWWGLGLRSRSSIHAYTARHGAPRTRRNALDVLCGLRTSVFFVIREAIGGFSFNRCSGLGIGRAFETQGIFSRGAAVSAEKRKGRGSMAGGFHPAFPPRTPRLRVRYCLACYWLLEPIPAAPYGVVCVA